MKFFRKAIIITIFAGFIIFPVFAHAQSLDIENDTINQMGQEKESENYKVNDALGQTTSGEILGDNFKIQSGTMYYDMIPLSFTISNTVVDFGMLTPKTPSTGGSDITVITNSPEGYRVTVHETTPLKLKNVTGTTRIPYGSANGDDLPFNSITESSQGNWNDYNTQFGFGFTVANLTGADATFTSGYREFADYSFSETPQEIMSKNGSTPETGASVRVTYQVNVDDIQPAGTYENTIVYILTATY